MSKRRAKTKPKFKTEDQEREFWGKHDVVDYFRPSTATRATFPQSQAFDHGNLNPLAYVNVG